MARIERLFDLLELYKEEYNGLEVAFAHKFEGEWRRYSPKDYIEYVDLVSYAFLKLGLQKGDTIALISSNRPEWNFIDMAAQQIGLVLVPIYPTISESEYDYILNHAEVKYVFTEGAELLAKIEDILPNVPTLKGICTFKDRQKYTYFQKLVQLGRENPNPEMLQKLRSEIKSNDMVTMIYTSGTTGDPKGVMLSHANIISNIMGVKDIPPVAVGDPALSFLPLCHVYERMLNYCWQYLGLEIYYCDPAVVANIAQEVKPRIASFVPRILEKVYDKIYTSGTKMPLTQKRIYYWALDLAERYKLENRSAWYTFQHQLADKLVYTKLRAVLGGNFKAAVTGGAAMQPRLAAFFTGIGVPIIEGYGLSETSPVISVSNFLKNGRKFGTVGPVLPGVEVKIAADGEILSRGPNTMLGYYKAPELTQEAIDADGWFHTGDLGRIEPEGQLKITGRKKSLFKTSFGKYVNPELIETTFQESPFIDNIMVVGEGQKFAAALISPDFEMLKAWYIRKGHGNKAPSTNEELVANKYVKQRFNKEVAKYNKRFGETEKVKKFTLVPQEWTPNTRELTQTLKLRRKHLGIKYQEEIQRLFA